MSNPQEGNIEPDRRILKRKLRRRLNDIVAYGASIIIKLETTSKAEFASDADLHDVVYFRLLCISEAVRNVSLLDPMIAERNPEIPWAQIRGMGNRLRHEYGDIDSGIVWETFARGDLQSLIDAAQSELSRLDG